LSAAGPTEIRTKRISDEPLAISFSLVLKRFFDVAIGLLLIIFLLPLMAAICIAIKFSSPGPIFYGHRRIGRGGKTFRVWKFRSMFIDAEKMLQECLLRSPELTREWLKDHKLREDPRITPLGRFLRKSSLDELPQIFNVLLGEMSLVGPRPIVSAEVPRYGESFGHYKKVRPGITGLWQVSGRNHTTYCERVALDRKYAQDWSIWLDFYILTRTWKVVLTGDGAF
jgi:Undecaprenyl-phosphate galactose phosphotransferase WbaP